MLLQPLLIADSYQAIWVTKKVLCRQMPAKDSLIKEGGDLLSHRRSTIGAGGLNFSVRNGKRWNPATVTTLILVTQCDKQS